MESGPTRRDFIIGGASAILGASVSSGAVTKPDKSPEAKQSIESLKGIISYLDIGAGSIAELKVVNGKVSVARSLDSKDAREMALVASLTKLLTVLVVYNLCSKLRIDRNTEIKITEGDKNNAHKSQNKKVKVGSKHSIDSLIQMMMVNSNNEAAEALARYASFLL